MSQSDTVPDKSQEKKDTRQQEAAMSWQLVLFKATGLSFLMFLGMAVLTVLVVGIFGYLQYQQYLQAMNLTHQQVKQYISEGWKLTPPQTDGRTNILVLGLDTVPNKSDAPPLTDTIMIASIQYATGDINLISLPRDLWSDEYKTKINALYYYGIEKYPNEPERFPAEVLSQLTGVELHKTVVFSLQSVAELIDAVGGVEVVVPTAFVDTEFPREDVDVTKTQDPALLYETIEFQTGQQYMDGSTALKYMRSRHSAGDTGTDTDRAHRQQLVLDALLNKLTQTSFMKDEQQIAKLYTWYKTYVQKTFPEPLIIAIGKALFPQRNSLSLRSDTISIFPDNPSGVLSHPPIRETQNQWSYTIRNQEDFKQEIYDKLSL